MEIFVARQPIFDAQKNVYGYELLFRSGLENYFNRADGDRASAQTLINSFVTIGLETLTGGKPAFINFTRDLLINEYATLFPPSLIVAEMDRAYGAGGHGGGQTGGAGHQLNEPGEVLRVAGVQSGIVRSLGGPVPGGAVLDDRRHR